ncbi:hypothetical protein [Myxococcus xanthus]|uniref:hypothetical protein n=1 Tax=Myxococcus xanthus TaxID=34 RepID=UPI00112C3C11|nr:hypothetical protein [Myxococcus xanthus]
MDSARTDPRSEFFIPLDQESLKLEYDKDSTPEEFHSIATAFDEHLWAVVNTASVPFYMAGTSAHSKIFMRFHTAERILALKLTTPGAKLSPELEKLAHEKAMARMTDEKTDFPTLLLDELRSVMDVTNLVESNRELLRQGLVLGWGALEVFTRDLLEALLNTSPSLATLLMNNADTKKLFTKGLTFDSLSEYNFDASRHMGTILTNQHPINTVESMKHVFGVLFPANTQLKSALDDRQLRIINQGRHVIVHRRGLIDRDYIRLAKEGTLGTRLVITPDKLEENLLVLRNTANKILIAATHPS